MTLPAPNIVSLSSVKQGQVVQRWPDLSMAVVCSGRSVVVEGKERRPMQPLAIGARPLFWDADASVHVLDIPAMAAEMERLDARGTEARKYLAAMIRRFARPEGNESIARLGADVLAEASLSEFVSLVREPDGGVTIRVRVPPGG